MENNKIKEFCKIAGITEEQFHGREKIYGTLYLNSVTTLPDNFAPLCGGDLDLSSERKYIGKKPRKKPIIPKPECAYIMRWKWRDREYIKVDGIFTRIISKKGNVYRVQRIAHKEVEYLVTDGNGKWAHGATLDEAKKDLIYKISNRDTSRYEDLTLDSELTHADMIECYRVITGACGAGTRHFVEDILPADKVAEKYTIREVIELTRGQYGADTFANFFKR